eukprot:1428252-Amphidinium_carterae.1
MTKTEHYLNMVEAKNLKADPETRTLHSTLHSRVNDASCAYDLGRIWELGVNALRVELSGAPGIRGEIAARGCREIEAGSGVYLSSFHESKNKCIHTCSYMLFKTTEDEIQRICLTSDC